MSDTYDAAMEINAALMAVNGTLQEILVVLKEMNQEGRYANGLREKMIERQHAANERNQKGETL